MYRALVLASKVASFLVVGLLHAVSASASVAHNANTKARDVRSDRAIKRLDAANRAAAAARDNLYNETAAFTRELSAIRKVHG